MAYDKRTGKQLREGAEVNYNNVDSSLLKYDETTGDSITSSNLQTNSKIPKLPNDKIIDNPSFDLPKSELDSEVARINKEKAQSESEISGLLKDIGITKGSEADIATKEGADKAQKEYDQYTSDLEAEKRRIDKFERDLLRNNPTGALRGGQADILANAKRDSLEKQADIAILGNAAKGRYDTAMDIAKRKVESALVPLQAELDAKKFVYENNKDLFSTAQLSKLNTLIKADEAKIESERKTKETIENLKIEAYKNGFRGDLAGVKTLDEALTRVGNYLMSPKEKLEIEKLKGDIAINTASLIEAKQTIGGTTGSPVSDIIAGSSKYGDKRLTDSQLEKIQKATSALGSMETLQGLLSQGKDGLDVSGPIKGRVRNLITKFGGDANAAAINATIQGLIPTVARGIFGEVGVLTDADIANYRKTVPNLVSDEEQNKFVSLVMYDVLSRSLENTLVSNANNQTNVSNFVNTYLDVKNRVNVLKSELGVVEPEPIDEVNKAKMESAWSVDSFNNNITETLNSFYN